MKSKLIVFIALCGPAFVVSGFSNTFELISLSGDTLGADPEQVIESFSAPDIDEAGQVAFGARFAISGIEAAYTDVLAPAFENNCVKCHGEGGVRQSTFDLEPIQSAQDLILSAGALETLIEKLESGDMPPNSEPPLNPGTRSDMIESLELLSEIADRPAAHYDAALQFQDGILYTLAATGETASIAGEDGQFDSIQSITATGGNSIGFVGSLSEGHDLSSSDLVISASLRGDPLSPDFEVIATNQSRPVIDFDGNTSTAKRHQYFGTPNGLGTHGFSFPSRLGLLGSPDVNGIWIAELPDPETDALPVLELAALGGIPLNGGSIVIAKPIALARNGAMQGALLATIADEDENDFNDEQGIWLLDESHVATLVAKTGDIAPGSGDPFLTLGQPAIDGDGNVYFWASLDNESQAEGLYRFDGGASALLITSEAPVDLFGVERSFNGFMDPVVGENGALAVLTVETDGNLNTLLSRTPGGEWSIVAQTGLQAPGAADGVVYDIITLPIMNAVGQIAFQATLSGSGDGISDTTDSGAWATDVNGAVVLIAREGDTIDLRPGFPAAIRRADIGGFNASGQLAINFDFTNNVTAIAIVGLATLPPPAISSQPSGGTTYDGETITLSVEADGQGPFTYQWSKDGVDIEGATGSELVIESVAGGDAGDYRVAVSSQFDSTESEVASISVASLPDAPIFVDHPLGDIVLKGEGAILDARAVSNTSVSYQWYFNDDPIAGATGSELELSPADSENEGRYYVTATSSGGAATSEEAEVLVTDKRLFNISARALVGTNANVLIAGFVVIGPDPKQVLIRGIGPSLADDNIDDPLELPRLELYNSDLELIHVNEGWQNNTDPDAILEASQAVGAGERVLNANDTAMLVELEQGLYTAMVRGRDDSTGVALVETFEIEDNLTRMTNISARAFVGTGNNVVIPGFIVDGDIPSRVLIRAIGPGLENQAVAGFLANPQIAVYDFFGNLVASNDGWQNLWDPTTISDASSQIGAFPLDENSEDAALLIDLDPGLYTIVTSGENETTGVALVEVYALP